MYHTSISYTKPIVNIIDLLKTLKKKKKKVLMSLRTPKLKCRKFLFLEYVC
jgi:hypothetical protein